MRESMLRDEVVGYTFLLLVVGALFAAVALSEASRESNERKNASPVSPPQVKYIDVPTVDIPQAYRTANWYGWNGDGWEGSCVHASLVMLLHWQGLHDQANWWKKSYGAGETPAGIRQKMESAGIDFAETTQGDTAFLEWALRTRRGACVTVDGGRHMVCLVHLDDTHAGLLDNNSPRRIVWMSRDAFLREWRHSRWQWAFTPVYCPPPPKPWIQESRS